LEVSDLLAGLLVNRGISTVEEATVFLNPEFKNLHDPFLLNGMEEAVNRIKKALSKKEKILIYGDYDVDGLTAAALLTSVLKEMGGSVCSYIPHRVKEGYGLNEEAIHLAYKNGVNLILTVDCGTNSLREVILARKLGIDTIITDHHEVESVALPPAAAVINPHQLDCSYPFKDLSGVGVAFKLAQGLSELQNVEEHLDLVALGTVADIVPVRGENRILVRYGLEKLAKTKKAGLRALMQASGISGDKLTSRGISFILAPRLNAPGRLDSAEKSLKLLLTESEEEASCLVRELEKNNRRRQAIQEKILKDAQEKIEREPENKLCPVIVLADESWHPGLVGIVASKLVESYCRPAILIAMGKEMGKGSCRSVGEFHILHALRECSRLLAGFGGHSQAAGLVIPRRNLGRFCERMQEVGEEKLAGKDLLPRLRIDMELDLSEVTEELVEDIIRLKPYGSGNSEPVFISHNVQAIRPRIVSGRHLKMQVLRNRRSVDAIGFGMGGYIASLNRSGSMDIAYNPQINTWEGKSELQLHLRDIKAG
jgi:single-stranded-DNA-specific exonuclease